MIKNLLSDQQHKNVAFEKCKNVEKVSSGKDVKRLS
jgi:hypothetical protein